MSEKELSFRYVYPSDLRDCYVNGVWGGYTPRGEIYMHFFSERHPIPKTVRHEVTEDFKLGPEIYKETGGDVVRLIQTSVIMDLDSAIAIRDWLSNKITQMQEKTLKK